MKAVSYYFSYFYEIFAKLKYNFIETKEETKNEFQNFRKEILIDLQTKFFRSIFKRSHLWSQAWWSGLCLDAQLHVRSYYMIQIIWTILCTTLCYIVHMLYCEFLPEIFLIQKIKQLSTMKIFKYKLIACHPILTLIH